VIIKRWRGLEFYKQTKVGVYELRTNDYSVQGVTNVILPLSCCFNNGTTQAK